ncbi:hypothetical protein NL108_009547 [Boleophthalmus pectinirostris]|nr:hypothetical protein NL108_009547 [Boleophthalmus pectinirostris]
MSRRGHLESVSCSCGHGYCVFCIKTYLEQQKLRDSYPQSEVDFLLATQFEPGDAQELHEKLQNSNFNFNFEELELQRSRPGSRRVSSQNFRNSQPVEVVEVEPITPDFNTREEFVRYSHEITLDHDTAYKDLALSEGNTRVTNIGRSQRYLDYPDRFSFFWQVLSVDSLAGRAYFELEWSGPWIYVAMAYQTIQRHGNTKNCGFGGNKESWALFCRQNSYNFWHDGKSSQVMGPVESRIGVYLDYEAGVLTFYSVQDETMTPLHRVQTTFARPLHVGLWMAVDATAVFCNLK